MTRSWIYDYLAIEIRAFISPELIVKGNFYSKGFVLSLQSRVKEIVKHVSEGMFEREEIVAVALLSALCGQNTFLYGPPGTAKSLISRRIACAFDSPTYFEYLMNRFSTPEDVFGPVSIKALKEDQYIRKTDNYLPKAEFAFLDEIWKSSPAILNTLLTLMNERLYRNGDAIEISPLKALIAASNETPDANQGLDALYDRFIVRLMVNPIRDKGNFDHLVNCKPTMAAINIPKDLRIKPEEWEKWLDEIHSVELSTETKIIIHLIRDEFDKQHDTLKVYVSDRRWQRASILMKASAYLNDRKTTNHSDALLLQHCLWTHEGNRQTVVEIVKKAVKDTGFDSGVSLQDLDMQKESLDKEINNELYRSEDIYETVSVKGNKFFKHEITIKTYGNNHRRLVIYIPEGKIKSQGSFHPLDEDGNEWDELTCNFDKQGVCRVTHKDRRNGNPETIELQPKVLCHKGDKKSDINSRLISSLSGSVKELRKSLTSILKSVETRQVEHEKGLFSPFVSQEMLQLATAAIALQIDSLRLRIKDCERLEALCG